MRPNEAHVWVADLDGAATEIARLEATLDAAERERAGRFRFERDRRRFIAAHGLARETLASYLHLDAAEVAFEYGANGKPRLAGAGQNKDTLRFNVSHSDALLLCAVTTGRDIGVDVEAVKTIAEMEEIARQSFSAEDQARWRAAAPSEKTAFFFRLWARREAIAKCSGVGIAQSAGNEPFGGAVVEWEPAPGFVGALAVASGGIELQIHQVVSPRAR